jgi:ribosomal-protein-alanine N-acetyltransferase
MRALVQIGSMGDGDVAAVAAIEGPTRMQETELREELMRPWSRLWVARERDCGVVAFAIGWHVLDELHILNLMTRADRRRRGIARALMNEVLDYGRLKRIKHMLLEVRRSNRPAIGLYRTLGFFAMGVRARYYPDNEDALEMVLTFDVETGGIVPHPDEVRWE